MVLHFVLGATSVHCARVLRVTDFSRHGKTYFIKLYFSISTCKYKLKFLFPQTCSMFMKPVASQIKEIFLTSPLLE